MTITHRRGKNSGFTLIEIMIVVSMIAIFMGVGIPSMMRAFERDDLARAVKDTIEGCKTARDRAILQGVPHGFRLSPDGTMEVETLPMEQRITQRGAAHAGGGGGESASQSAGPYSGFPRQLGEDVMIQLVSVNFLDYMEAEAVRVRFFPNGTSDEFTVVFNWKGKQRTVTVDIVTGNAVELRAQ